MMGGKSFSIGWTAWNDGDVNHRGSVSAQRFSHLRNQVLFSLNPHTVAAKAFGNLIKPHWPQGAIDRLTMPFNLSGHRDSS